MLNWLKSYRYNHRAFIQSLRNTGEGVTTLLQTVIVYFGAMIALVFVVLVEQQRVMHGISLFEESGQLASFAAWALVIVSLTIEFMRYHIELKAGYKHQTAYRPSLRLNLHQFQYWIGMGKDGQEWQPEALSPATPYIGLQRFLAFTVLVLALLGSMKSAFDTQTGHWYDGLVAVVTQSDLTEFMTWLGGLLYAYAAVWSVQRLTAYIALRTAEINAAMDADQQQAAAPLARWESALEEDTKEVITYGEVSETDSPLASPQFSSNGRHSPVD